MRLSELTHNDLSHLMASEGVILKTGPLSFRISSRLPSVVNGLEKLYASYELGDKDSFVDYHINLIKPSSWRRWFRPQVEFKFDCRTPFKPLPLEQAFPMLEWGMNWCIANHNYQWLIIHAAVIAKNDMAAILPAPPGSGKSTLCAGLVGKGWRLLSDELTVIDPRSGLIIPMPRPISLKNRSIDVISRFVPEAKLGPVWRETRKGTISHMAAPEADSVNVSPVKPAWVIFPEYRASHDAILSPLSKPECLIQVAHNAFNFDAAGVTGFRALAGLMEACDTYTFTYSRLDEAVTLFNRLADATTIE